MSKGSTWTLYYWPIAGRGEFIRLMFEDAGVKFIEINDSDKIKEAVAPGKKWPGFAVPVIENPSGARLSQTPAICKYLGRLYGLHPDTPLEEAKAEQAFLTVADCWTEFSKISGMYMDKDEEGLEKFKTERAPKFLDHFEAALLSNRGGNGYYIVGLKPTFADIGLMNLLRVLEEGLGEEDWANLFGDKKLLNAFKKRMEGRQNVAAYLKSGRQKPVFRNKE